MDQSYGPEDATSAQRGRNSEKCKDSPVSALRGQSCPTAALEVILHLPPLHIAVDKEGQKALLRMDREVRGNRRAPRGLTPENSHLLNLPRDHIKRELNFKRNFATKLGYKYNSSWSETQTIKSDAIQWYTDGSKTCEGTGARVFGPETRHSEPGRSTCHSKMRRIQPSKELQLWELFKRQFYDDIFHRLTCMLVHPPGTPLLEEIENKCLILFEDIALEMGGATLPNSLCPTGLPPQKLTLKLCIPVMLLRNLKPPKLCNGTRLRITNLKRFLVEARILSGCAAGETVFIPRVPLLPTDSIFKWRRLQFPLRPCFGMTINKSQGQTLKGSLHRFRYMNFCVNVYTCISVVRPLIDVNLNLN